MYYEGGWCWGIESDSGELNNKIPDFKNLSLYIFFRLCGSPSPCQRLSDPNISIK